MDKVPLNNSHDPIAWQRAADALVNIGHEEAAKICHDTAGDMMKYANQNDTEVVEIEKPA